MRALTLSAALLCTAAPLRAEVPAVITDIPAVHSLAAQVMGELGTPDLLLPPGADPHHASLKPSQARALSGADLVFWMGPEMSPWLEGPMETLAQRGAATALLDAEGTVLRHYAEGEGHDHGEDHAHDDHEGHDDHAGHEEAEHDDHAHDDHDEDHADSHDHTGVDPHAWLSPVNASAWLGLMAQAMAAHDPENAATYTANAAAAQARITGMTGELAALLPPVRETRLVFAHDAYGYFTDTFDLNAAGAIAEGDAAAPGAATLRAMREVVQPAAQTCLFTEPQHSPAHVETLRAEFPELGGGTLDPSGSSLEPGPALYEALMRGLAEAIATCRAAS